MTIRPATHDDIPAVLPMVNKIGRMHEALDPGKYGFLDEPARLYGQWLSERVDDPQSVFLVAEREATAQQAEAPIVGFLLGTTEHEIPIYRVREFGFLHDLWIEPDYRNEGLARQMVMLAIERYRSVGVPQVRCDTLLANEPARRLFEQCGFRPSIVEMLLELPA
jgi:ribosomal protein S18 acetylase RimI-like enzyme